MIEWKKHSPNIILFHEDPSTANKQKLHYSKAQILRTCILWIHAYSEVIWNLKQNPFKMIRKMEG